MVPFFVYKQNAFKQYKFLNECKIHFYILMDGISTIMFPITEQLANEFGISKKTVTSILTLIHEGASIPFIARYRKEATQGLTDTQLRAFDQRQAYLNELTQRRSAIIEQLKSQNRLTEKLESAFLHIQTKKELEDLYAPFKKEKISKVELAKKLNLEGFAHKVWGHWNAWNTIELSNLIKKTDKKLDIDELKELLTELFAEDILLQSSLLEASKAYFYKNGSINSQVIRGKKESGEKYQDYFNYSEQIRKAPSHRLLALFRAKKEGILKLSIQLSDDCFPHSLLNIVSRLDLTYTVRNNLSSFQKEILNSIWTKKIRTKLESLIFSELKEKAEIDATNVFAQNLTDLLMAPPAGQKSVLALDPGFKNGVKIAVIDKYGNYLDHEVIYPHPPQNRTEESSKRLSNLIEKYHVQLIAIGNGTASRETEQFVNKLIRHSSEEIISIMVSESGASVYSASELATQEFPELDVTIRGAISIARRLQDPLAELIKIDPKSIGVGQYQHDIKSKRLEQALENVVEDCVNHVGVDLNLASTSLLSHVSGLSLKLAENIVQYRQENNGIKSRTQLKKVKGIGAKCFEQCAGFLRIQNGNHPLDASGVHPESYSVVEEMAKTANLKVENLITNKSEIDKLKLLRSQFSHVDSYTFNDILSELTKPGRDPRPDFSYVTFDKNISTIEDLVEGMTLEGVATNIAAFGVFVDIGVHQDGLIHISQLADRFVKNPADLVKVGQIMKVEVMDVEVKRKRISLKAIGL